MSVFAGFRSVVSIHVPLAEHDGGFSPTAPDGARFNSRAPRGARHNETWFWLLCTVSIHVPLAEHDMGDAASLLASSLFQFTCPSRSTTPFYIEAREDIKFQFTCTSRSTTSISCCISLGSEVSIHVPLAEHDQMSACYSSAPYCFNSRAPRGARLSVGALWKRLLSFNSRAPRGARPASSEKSRLRARFNSRAPRGARRCQ